MITQDDTKWKKVVAGDSKPPFYVFDGAIQKSEQDDRDYRLIRLENGLHAMLIHDATADKAAASLDVAVGHLYDPVGTHSKLLALPANNPFWVPSARYARTSSLLRTFIVHGMYSSCRLRDRY
jgi:hypothetical protein